MNRKKEYDSRGDGKTEENMGGCNRGDESKTRDSSTSVGKGEKYKISSVSTRGLSDGRVDSFNRLYFLTLLFDFTYVGFHF